MDYFWIDSCPHHGCNSWRFGDYCIKHKTGIEWQLEFVKDMHTPQMCMVRKQADEFRLRKLLED